jgi:RNase_H superfamily
MIYLDLETLDFFSDPTIAALPRFRQLAALRFGLATTFDAERGCITWWPHQLADLWDALCTSEQIVTWNGDEFDLPYLIIQVVRAELTTDPWAELPASLDLMDLVKREAKRQTGKERWYKLDTIAQANLGRSKIGHGDEAAAWLRSGDDVLVDQAAAYCRDDVQIVVDLHQQLLDGKPLVCPARPDRREYNELIVSL